MKENPMREGIFWRSNVLWICGSTSFWNLFSYQTLPRVRLTTWGKNYVIYTKPISFFISLVCIQTWFFSDFLKIWLIMVIHLSTLINCPTLMSNHPPTPTPGVSSWKDIEAKEDQTSTIQIVLNKKNHSTNVAKFHMGITSQWKIILE